MTGYQEFVGIGQGPGFFSKHPTVNTGAAGKLKVTVNNRDVSASFKPVNSISGPMELNIAVLGMGLSTRIKAGENEGRLAAHEFVVLGHRQVVSNNYQWQTSLPDLQLRAGRYALAAWISVPGNPAPLQSTGGYLTVSVN